MVNSSPDFIVGGGNIMLGYVFYLLSLMLVYMLIMNIAPPYSYQANVQRSYHLFVIGRYSINEEYDLLTEILGSQITVDQVDNNGMRVYELDYGIKIYSDGFGMFLN